MAKKAKKKVHRMPPLSFADKLIYWMVFLILMVSYAALAFVPLLMRSKIAFADECVIAVQDRASVFWLFVPWMTWFLMTFILWYSSYEQRKPIFGKRNFKYGPPAWPKEYPLFMKNKPYVFVSERKRKERKQIAVLLLVILLVSFIPLPWSLYGRNCLHSDGGIVQYNVFNAQTREFAPEDISDIKIEVFRHGAGKSSRTYWGVQMVFTAESGRRYTFDYRDFRSTEQGEPLFWLEAMLHIKKQFHPSIIRYEDVEDIDYVIWDSNMSQEEMQLLYQLFGQE